MESHKGYPLGLIIRDPLIVKRILLLFIHIYNYKMGQYNINTLNPLVKKPCLEMRLQDWRVANFKFENVNLPLIYDIQKGKSSSNMVYDNYVRDSHPIGTFKNKFESTITKNHFLFIKLKYIEMEKG